MRIAGLPVGNGFHEFDPGLDFLSATLSSGRLSRRFRLGCADHRL